MTKRVKYTAICKGWKLINPHLLRPRSESDAFCALVLVVMEFLLWKEGSGFKGGGGVKLSFTGF